jgi:hypothetical protein
MPQATGDSGDKIWAGDSRRCNWFQVLLNESSSGSNHTGFIFGGEYNCLGGYLQMTYGMVGGLSVKCMGYRWMSIL